MTSTTVCSYCFIHLTFTHYQQMKQYFTVMMKRYEKRVCISGIFFTSFLFQFVEKLSETSRNLL
ncbi:hypothetical protein C0J52_08351 [Blattella germanica]|nr:hypothetical protein C0J52_08351 [Blattella germanica]